MQSIRPLVGGIHLTPFSWMLHWYHRHSASSGLGTPIGCCCSCCCCGAWLEEGEALQSTSSTSTGLTLSLRKSNPGLWKNPLGSLWRGMPLLRKRMWTLQVRGRSLRLLFVRCITTALFSFWERPRLTSNGGGPFKVFSGLVWILMRYASLGLLAAAPKTKTTSQEHPLAITPAWTKEAKVPSTFSCKRSKLERFWRFLVLVMDGIAAAASCFSLSTKLS
mmetsp:Transcript_8398/g.21647  ORF Transcript_8398/g.21647 Transcript_8398/m.21647 type:complete len:220 (-) Transcript_8398:3-662(-)